MANKAKTHSGASKRFKVTGSGRVKFKHTNRRHLLRKRSTRQKRELRIDGMVQFTEIDRVRGMLNLPMHKKATLHLSDKSAIA